MCVLLNLDLYWLATAIIPNLKIDPSSFSIASSFDNVNQQTAVSSHYGNYLTCKLFQYILLCHKLVDDLIIVKGHDG